MDSIFPMPDGENRAICVSGVGSTKLFSALVVNSMPDIQLIFNGQCFPRYRYQGPSDSQGRLPGLEDDLERFDNITDATLRKFRTRYQDPSITKDAIFDYVYGLLHAPGYRERFANDLSKALPRIPLAQDFSAFAQAGSQLATLHLGYETCEEYPLELTFTGEEAPRPEHFRIGKQKMRFTDAAKSELIINDHIRLTSIPAEAHQYEVNGRTPLEWLIDRYRITQDNHSGIVNDPNA